MKKTEFIDKWADRATEDAYNAADELPARRAANREEIKNDLDKLIRAVQRKAKCKGNHFIDAMD